MKSGGYEFQGPFALKHIAQGKREQAVRDVIEVLEARGLEIPVAVRQRVASCEDIAELERWLRRAAVVKSASELFEAPVS